MAIFCLLWVPLFFLFRRTVSPGNSAGGVWALLLGSITAILQFLLGYFISPGGFGFSRWLFGFVDIVSLPVLIPLVLHISLMAFRGFPGSPDFAGFALLWLIPVAALRAINWSSLSDPILLVIVPLLWTALAVGIPFFINILMERLRWYFTVTLIFCLLVLPAAAAAAYWAFSSQLTVLGFILFSIVQFPVIFSIARDCWRPQL